MPSRPLTEGFIRNLKPKQKPYKVADGGGLYVLVTPTSKLWRLDYRIEGKRKTKALGAYGTVSLPAARTERELAKAMLRDGRDPCATSGSLTAAAVAPTFKQTFQQWHAANVHRWTPGYAAQVRERIKADILPTLGERPVAEIGRAEMLKCLQEVEKRGTFETVRRLKQYCSGIFRYAAASDDKQGDPTLLLKGALKTPPRPKHHKALKGSEIGGFMLALDRYDGETETRLAVTLALLTVVRTTELRAARWEEFSDLDKPAKALWRVPAERMKMKEEHLVPLSRAACEALLELKKLTGASDYLFPDAAGRGKFMSQNTMLFACYRMGYRGRLTVHGFRRTFSTEANEASFPSDHIELQLAHDERDKVRGAYNAAQQLAGRRKLLAWWSDHLADLKKTARQNARFFGLAPQI